MSTICPQSWHRGPSHFLQTVILLFITLAVYHKQISVSMLFCGVSCFTYGVFGD
jgi:hypothetical protein